MAAKKTATNTWKRPKLFGRDWDGWALKVPAGSGWMLVDYKFAIAKPRTDYGKWVRVKLVEVD